MGLTSCARPSGTALGPLGALGCLGAAASTSTIASVTCLHCPQPCPQRVQRSWTALHTGRRPHAAAPCLPPCCACLSGLLELQSGLQAIAGK